MSSLATCSDVIRFWDTGGGGSAGGGLELRKTTNVAAAATNSCCWNHNGQVVATAGDNGSITVLKLSGSIVPAGVLSAHERPIRGIAFSSKSRKLAAGGDAGVVEVWDLKRNNSRVTMRGHRGSVTCVSFFDRDSCVAAGDERGKVVLHRVADAPSDDEASATLPPAGGYASVTGLCMSSAAAGAAMLGVSYADGVVRLWDTGSRACVREMEGQHRGAAAGIVFHPHNPSLMATVGHDGVARCTDVRTGGQQKDGVLKAIQTDAPLTCGSFHHEGLMLAAGASDGTVRLIDLRTAREIGGAGSPKKAYAGPSPPSGGVRALAFQRQPPARSSTASGGATPASEVGGAGVSNGTSKGARASSTESSRYRPSAAAAGAATAPSSSDVSRAGRAGGGSGQPKLLPGDGSGGGGANGGGNGSAGWGNGEGSGGRRRSALATSPRTGVDRLDLAGTATAAAVVEGTPVFPAGSSGGSTQHPQQQQQQRYQQRYQQPAAEHTSSSRGNGDYYSPAAAGSTGGRRGFVPGESEKTSPASKQRHREPYGFSGAGAAVAAGAGARRDHQSVATPPRERDDEASQLWSDDDHRAGMNGTPASRADRHGGGSPGPPGGRRSSAPPPPPPPPPTRRRPDSSSPERVAAGFGRRKQENGATGHGRGGGGSGGGSGVMATGEVDEWNVPRTTGYDNGHGGKDAAAFGFASTPRSRGPTARSDATGGGGSGDGDYGARYNGDAHAGSRLSTPVSPSRAPRKRSTRTGSPSAGAGARAGTAAAAADAEGALVRREAEGAAAACGGRVVSVDRSVLEQVLSSHMSGLREELRQELRNLHVDMLRQFHSLQDEQSLALSGFEERLGGLVAENQALRAENDRLRRVY